MLKIIRDGLIRIAKRIGHWIVRRFAQWAATKLVAWLTMKAEDWELRGIRPWLRKQFRAAAKWIKANTRTLSRCAAAEFHQLADEQAANGVPEVCREAVAA